MGISPFRTPPFPGQIRQTEFELGNVFRNGIETHIVNIPLQTDRHSRLGEAPDSHSVTPVSKLRPETSFTQGLFVVILCTPDPRTPKECLELGTRPLALTFQFVIHYSCSTNRSYCLEFLTVVLNEPKMVKFGV